MPKASWALEETKPTLCNQFDFIGIPPKKRRSRKQTPVFVNEEYEVAEILFLLRHIPQVKKNKRIRREKEFYGC